MPEDSNRHAGLDDFIENPREMNLDIERFTLLVFTVDDDARGSDSGILALILHWVR